ncbi:unnamed protein product [Dracunculus medinensis]|uniref:BAH domain-containing protein n=1 Tax=Dracunculus medinensis TaxID=318479 RepID=A0A0N4ULB7_DRAME|nr:unnamed protein product [Dracunculus medinensis]
MSNLNGSSAVPSASKKRTSQRIKAHSSGIVLRRTSARAAALSNKSLTGTRKTLENTVFNKYISRRTSLFKNTLPLKAPSLRATMKTHESLFNSKGILFRVGDIISAIDKENGKKYFAQIRGLLTDIYAEKSVALNWFVPLASAADPHIFDAEHFVHAVSDSKFYKLETLDSECLSRFISYDFANQRCCLMWKMNNYPLPNRELLAIIGHTDYGQDCTFLQHVPDLPEYRWKWSPLTCAMDQLRSELCERWKNIRRLDNIQPSLMDKIGIKDDHP